MADTTIRNAVQVTNINGDQIGHLPRQVVQRLVRRASVGRLQCVVGITVLLLCVHSPKHRLRALSLNIVLLSLHDRELRFATIIHEHKPHRPMIAAGRVFQTGIESASSISAL